jgi:hypothetical protein
MHCTMPVSSSFAPATKRGHGIAHAISENIGGISYWKIVAPALIQAS